MYWFIIIIWYFESKDCYLVTSTFDVAKETSNLILLTNEIKQLTSLQCHFNIMFESCSTYTFLIPKLIISSQISSINCRVCMHDYCIFVELSFFCSNYHLFWVLYTFFFQIFLPWFSYIDFQLLLCLLFNP